MQADAVDVGTPDALLLRLFSRPSIDIYLPTSIFTSYETSSHLSSAENPHKSHTVVFIDFTFRLPIPRQHRNAVGPSLQLCLSLMVPVAVDRSSNPTCPIDMVPYSQAPDLLHDHTIPHRPLFPFPCPI